MASDAALDRGRVMEVGVMLGGSAFDRLRHRAPPLNDERWKFEVESYCDSSQTYRVVLCSGLKNSCSSRSTCNNPSRLSSTWSPSIVKKPQSFNRCSGSAKRFAGSTPNFLRK